MKSNRIRNGLLILAGLVLVSMCSMQITVCKLSMPDEFQLSSGISAFVGTDDYTIADLVTTSQQKIQEQLGFLDEAESEFVSAFYACQNSDCTLFEVHLKVFAQRKMGCVLGGDSSSSADDPLKSTITDLSFDIANDELSTITHIRDDNRRNLVSWEELPLNIDEIIQIALTSVEDDYMQEHPEIELAVTLLRDRWTVTFRPDASTEPDIRLHINYNGKLLAE